MSSSLKEALSHAISNHITALNARLTIQDYKNGNPNIYPGTELGYCYKNWVDAEREISTILKLRDKWQCARDQWRENMDFWGGVIDTGNGDGPNEK
jgi:hypothetical protein